MHDTSCVPTINEVVLPAGTLEKSTDIRESALRALGYTSPARSMVFADAMKSHTCGSATLYNDHRPAGNLDDGLRVQYSRVDPGCWITQPGYHSTPAHELVHMLGAVQRTSPAENRGTQQALHSRRALHRRAGPECYADRDRLEMDFHACPDWHASLMDYGNDDYLHMDPPPGSYLAEHWNLARSTFLTTAPPLAAALTAKARLRPLPRPQTFRVTGNAGSGPYVSSGTTSGTPTTAPAPARSHPRSPCRSTSTTPRLSSSAATRICGTRSSSRARSTWR